MKSEDIINLYCFEYTCIDGELNYDGCYELWQENYEFLEKIGKIPDYFERD
ncbi:MAG: hypothetical protein MR739_06080 [Spirochaetia bacterium]|nr:hypothetical protein [Spirochaetia bacterium]